MVDKEALFVLGALDPEMREIAHVLRGAERRYVHAAKGGGRVSTRTAYEADAVLRPSRWPARGGDSGFMAMHRLQGREVYGNPHRGYAGAYIA